MSSKNKGSRWSILIPIIFWLACIALAIGKMIQAEKDIKILDWMDVFNSNTYSTYVPMTACMIYQFFSTDGKKKQKKIGLSRKWIWLTIVSVCIYSVMAVVNACRYTLGSTILMLVVSIAYVYVFFKFMVTRT